jgi:gamma-glutamyltranspeptidase/glutathione hydrolase
MRRTTLRVVKDEVVASGGMVVAQHPLIAEAGAEILAAGGNAVDAAVAAAFAAGVVEPFMSGIGGGGGLIYHDSRAGRSIAVEFIMRVPRAAGPDTFALDPNGGPDGIFGWPAVVDKANRIGWRSALVPGAVAGLCLALERFGTLPLARALEPALRLAEEGFPADWYLCLNVACAMPELLPFPSTAVFLPNGHPPRARLGFNEPTDRFVQRDLAHTLRAIAAEGPRAFYEGAIAQSIVRAMREHGGLISHGDLASYRPVVYEAPLSTTYRQRYRIETMPACSSGPTLVEMLHVLEGFDLATSGHNTVDTLHLLAETMRRAYVDRFAHMADPDATPVPIAGLTARGYADARRATIDPLRADLHPAPGDPWAFEGRAAERGENASPVLPPDATCTTHLCVVDRERRMVTLTNTLGELFGSRVVVPGTGILLNDGMVWFDPRPGTPNALQPGRRPLNNMAPTLVLRDGRPFLAVGAPGGRKILTGVLQTLLNVVDFGLGVQEAAGAPRIHSEGPETYVDSRLPVQVHEGLRQRGQQVVPLEETFAATNFSRVVGILVDEASGVLRGGVHLWQPATAVGLDG